MDFKEFVKIFLNLDFYNDFPDFFEKEVVKFF